MPNVQWTLHPDDMFDYLLIRWYIASIELLLTINNTNNFVVTSENLHPTYLRKILFPREVTYMLKYFAIEEILLT